MLTWQCPYRWRRAQKHHFKLPLLVQEVLGIEISGLEKNFGVSQHGTQHREHQSLLRGGGL